jgi:glycosyltransferase involved in cell wall biosynthesis
MFPVVEVGRGGFGRHAWQVQQYLETRGTVVTMGPNWEERPDKRVNDRWRWMGGSPEIALDQYDRWCAETLTRAIAADAVIAFPGAALNVFRSAPRGVEKVLVTTTFDASTHRSWATEAIRHAPIERTWLTRSLALKMDQEIDLADTVISNSALTTRTFVDAGQPAEKFVHVPLTPRELDPTGILDPAVDVLYLGALTVEKGVVDLIRAFTQIEDPSVRLRLMGGPRSPGMRAYLRRVASRDPRIRFGPGDPSRQLPTARLLVHPSYVDSFAYAVAEAVAAGIPVITTDRVGASDLIREGLAHADSRLVNAGERSVLRDSIRAILGTR